MNYSLIIPIYNEIKALPKLLNQIQHLISHMEIILIDDGSNDGSSEILFNYCKTNETILLNNINNRGKGYSIIKGLKSASGKTIILADGDLEIDITILPRLIDTFEEVTKKNQENIAIIGIRKRLGIQNSSPIFYLGNKCVNLFFNYLYGTNFKDILCCLKIINRKKISEFNLISQGFDIETEIMAKIVKSKMTTQECEIDYESRSLKDGKKIKFFHTIPIIKRMILTKFLS